MSNFIYLDNNATTKPDPKVVAAMADCLENNYANASSSHLAGRTANSSVKKARQQLANLINCDTNELIFTSGATESINLALKGIAERYRSKGQHIVTIETEHPAVLETCKYLETIGYDITYLPVKKDGLIDLSLFKEAITPKTILACVMYVNNETGVIQEIKKLAEIAHDKGALFMTDATQAVGKCLLDVRGLGVDILCLSGHKFYGPKGIGALYVKSNRIQISEQMHGGNQENSLRSGTLNVPGIIGLGVAAEIAFKELTNDQERIEQLRNFLESELLKVEGVFVNGDRTNRLYNITNLCFEGIDTESIMAELENIIISNGSACTSSLIEPSHVLSAMGLSNEQAFSSIRFSLGRFNTKEDIEITIEHFKRLLKKEEYQKLDNESRS